LTSVTIGNGVTSIGYYAFNDCISLTSVMIPAGVTSIGDEAFAYCTRLTAITVDTQNSFYSSTNGVLFDKSQTTLIQFPGGLSGSYTIPGSVTRIGDFAFADSTSLTSVTIPASVTGIGYYAFNDCTSLTSATIPASVTSIETGVFANCSLTNVVIPASVTSIGDWAFEDCTNLARVTIPASVTSIGDEAFAYCTRLTAIAVDTQNSFYSSTNGVLFDKSQSTLIQFPGGLSGSYTIPASVTSIGDYAFADSTNLSSVTIPGSVTSIGEWAFSDCTNLTSVTISYGVASIGDYAFAYCASLTSVTIPGSVASVGDEAFEGCTTLTSVYFGGNAPTADSYVFDGDSNATVFYLAGTTGWGYSFAGLLAVQSNPQSEFTYTTNAAAITITGYFGPGGTVIIPATINGLPVTSIGSNAFLEDTSLINVTIPAGITNIGDYAFVVCTSLASVVFEGNAPTVGSSVFALDNNATVFYVPGTTGWNSTFAGLPAVLFQFTPANMMPFTHPANNATLVVTLVPAEANGQWRFPWELTWRGSGTAATNLVPSQNYTVEFSPVPGYLAIPALVTNFVAGGTTNFVTGQYYPTITSVDTNSGGSLEVLFQVNAPSGAGWRLLGDTNAFLPSGFTTNLLPGDYLIQCAALSNFVRIPILSVQIAAGLPTVVQEIYQPSQPAPTAILLPVPVPSGEISDTNYPYGFNGQLETDVGYGSGVAVQANVVLTAAHLVFNDQTLSYVSQAWWYPQEEAPQFVPEPQAAQGWLVLSGYASQRTNDLQSGLYPDQSSPQSRNFDVAALYFQSSVAGGGYGGYLPSDATSNSWLTSTAEKMLVGYPVDASMFQGQSVQAGQMYEIGPQPYPLSLATDPVNDQQVYTASWFLSYPGNSGGPFYVQLNGYYYPAGVYLGTLSSGASAVRAIDGNVVNLITNAQTIVTTGTNNSGGGVVTFNAGAGIANYPGAVEVTISPPAVVQAGACWKFISQSDSWYSTQNPSTLAVNSTNAQLQFTNIPGWNLPANQSVTVVPGVVTCLTNFYTLAVSWPTPAAITYGTALNSTQLNATNVIGVPGNYAYSPTNGSVLNVGTNTLSVIFTPSDTNEYGGASATNVSLVVLPPPPDIQTMRRSGSSFTFTWSAMANQQYQIQTKTNLIEPNWTTLSNVLTATNSSMTTVASIGANSQQFYRVVLLP
ncbi:MAG: leucine-rich repeat protein, partial [Verrucomicrobiota bacterium]